MGLGSFFKKATGLIGTGLSLASGNPAFAMLGSSLQSSFDSSAQQKFLSSQYANNYGLAYNQLYNRHQIEVADLKAAGLNPILSANGGASTFNPGTVGSVDATSQKAAALATASQVGLNTSVAQKNLADAKLSNGQFDLLAYQARALEAETSYKNAMTGAIPIHVDLEKAMTEDYSASAKVKIQSAKSLENENSVFMERWNLQKQEIAARIYSLYASGQCSLAQASAAYTQALVNIATEANVNAHTANTIAEGEGIVFRNNLAKWQSERESFELSYMKEHPFLTMGSSGFRDIGIGIGSVGQAAGNAFDVFSKFNIPKMGRIGF